MRNSERRLTVLEQAQWGSQADSAIIANWYEGGRLVATTVAPAGPVDYRRGLPANLVDARSGQVLARFGPGMLSALMGDEVHNAGGVR